MRLSRDKIQRMIDASGLNTNVRRGGGGGAGGGGGVSSQWVDEHYVSKEFFARLFTINGTTTEGGVTTDVVVEPNDPETTITNIQMMVGAWTEQYLSALGLSDGGSGGGAIALQDLVNVEYVGTPSGGQILKYNGTTGKWYNADESGGTVQDVTLAMPSGFKVTKATNNATVALTVALDRGEGASALGNKLFLATPVTGSGVPLWRTIAEDDLPDLSETYAKVETIYTKTQADEKFMTIEAFERLFNPLNSSKVKLTHPYASGLASIKAMVGLWTDEYLSALGQSSGQGGGGATTLGGLVDVTLSGAVPGQILQYDGRQWINVNMPASGVTSIRMTVPEGFAVTPTTAITTSGTFAISFSGSVAKNKVLAAPSTAAGVPSWRVLAVADIPDLSGTYLPLSGGTLTGNLYFDATGLGVWLKDSASHQYAGIYDNGTNLWIGSTESSGTHHTGSTYISAGSGDVYINRIVSGVRREYKVLDANNGVTIDTAQTITGQKTFGKTILFSSGNFALAISATDTWTDGNSNKHYWYGYDHRYHNTGVYSTTISDYFGITLRTGSGYLSMNQSGNVGIGTYAPSYKLDVSGTINCTSIRIGGYTITADTTNVGLRINGAGLYADTYISALGASTGGGGGGGVTLNEPLSSINTANLGSPSGTDMAIAWNGNTWIYKQIPNSGGGGVTLNEPLASINTANLGSPSGTDMAIAWNGNTWIYKQIPSSGGGGSGVTSVGMTVPTGFSVNPGSIASSGTFAITFASGYSLPTTAKQGQWDEAYNAKHSHSNKSTLDGISSTKVDQWDAAYTWTNANGGSTVSKTAWGRTYWSAGTPQNVSGDLTSVGNITMTDDSSGVRKIQFDASDNFNIRKISDRFIIKSNGTEVINIYNNQFYSAVEIKSAVGVLSNGYVTALSDIRYKDVVARVSPRVEDIAEASIIRYTWKDRTDKTIHIGGIAQEWQKILPETVLDSEGRLSMDYGVIGTIAAIATARRVVDHEARIKALEKEIELLKAMQS